MQYWLSKVNDLIAFQRRNREDIAKEIGISGPGLSRNLSNKREFSFLNVPKLLDLVCDDPIEKSYMLHEFCREMKNPKNIRLSMEYANAIGDLRLLATVIQKGFECDNRETREWAYIYELVWMRLKGVMKSSDLFSELERRKKKKSIKTHEMSVLLNILSFYIMYDLEKFNSLYDYAEMLRPEVLVIKEEFLRIMYTNRVREGLAYAYLTEDKLETARTLCHDILNEEDKYSSLKILKVSSLVYLSESFTFESYDQSSWYFNKAYEMLGDCQFEREIKRKKHVMNTHAFLKMIYKRDLADVESFIFNKDEEALYNIVKGDNEVAIAILQRQREEQDGFHTPIQLTYLAMANNNDIHLLEEAIRRFITSGNHFYCKLPRKILVEMNKNGIIQVGDAK